ncbi:MAG: winged helix-turn-helix transcriptional regulator [Clostridia bacterium]|nr:winged helix-turn-helix transcriptional regulator [Clostridia bacterium]
MISRFERFSLSIFEISRCWHKIAADEMARYGLKGPHAIYLIAMNRNPEGLTSSQLTETCNRDKADVSRAMSAMEESGLVEKDLPGNRYRARLKLTEEGREAALHICKRAAIAVEAAGKGMDDSQRKVFYETLELIASNLRELSEEGLPKE